MTTNLETILAAESSPEFWTRIHEMDLGEAAVATAEQFDAVKAAVAKWRDDHFMPGEMQARLDVLVEKWREDGGADPDDPAYVSGTLYLDAAPTSFNLSTEIKAATRGSISAATNDILAIWPARNDGAWRVFVDPAAIEDIEALAA